VRAAQIIAQRELASYFRTPSGWLIVALYLFLTGIVFALFVLAPGQPASLRDFFGVSGWLLLPVAPAISMRLISDELRSGSIESLLTSPVSSAGVVMGKFFGAAAFLLAMLLPTGVYVALLFRVAHAPPDLGPVVCGYLCLLLLGMLYLAMGTLASTLTSNSTLAFLVTLFAALALLFAGSAAEHAPAWMRGALFGLSVPNRVTDFARGVIDTSNIVFFLSGTALCLFGAVCVMDLRRWR
jgi:ABC-2 type transport system permease protein